MARQAPLQHWKGQTTTETICGQDVAPAATQLLLGQADQAPIDVGAMAYATCAHMVEANTTGTTVRRFAVVVPPASRRARLHVTRSGGSANSTTQASTTAGSTTSGGFTGASVVTASSPTWGDERYLGADATHPSVNVQVLVTADVINDTPGASTNRAFKLPEALHPSIEEFEVTMAAGVGVEVFSRTPDLEAL